MASLPDRAAVPSKRRTPAEVASVNGTELEYQVVGTGEPVVLIHGAFIADTFQPLLTEPHLADAFRLIAYRRRGYSRTSDGHSPVSIAMGTDDCRALLEHLGVKRTHVIGHSYGGCVAVQMALDYPELVGSLCLLEPGLAIGESGDGYRSALAEGGRRYREVPTEVVLDEFLEARWPGYRDRLENTLPGAFARAVRDARTWFERELDGQLAWSFGETEIRRIAQPTLSVLGGGSEVLWSRFGETHRLLMAWLADPEGFVLPGATHFLHLESPRRASQMAEALATFLERHRLLTDT